MNSPTYNDAKQIAINNLVDWFSEFGTLAPKLAAKHLYSAVYETQQIRVADMTTCDRMGIAQESIVVDGLLNDSDSARVAAQCGPDDAVFIACWLETQTEAAR